MPSPGGVMMNDEWENPRSGQEAEAQRLVKVLGGGFQAHPAAGMYGIYNIVLTVPEAQALERRLNEHGTT